MPQHNSIGLRLWRAMSKYRTGKDHKTSLAAAEIEPYFDRDYYARTYPGAMRQGLDPVVQYIKHGARAGNNPSPKFSTKFYLNIHPDVQKSGINPLLHYIRYGEAEGRFPNEKAAIASEFDEAFYVARYPDVMSSGMDALSHFMKFGIPQTRDPNPHFSSKYYVKQVPLARRPGLSAFGHYITLGRQQGFLPKSNSPENPAFAGLFRSQGVNPATIGAAIIERESDVAARLKGGVLADMVRKAAVLEPLVLHPAQRRNEPVVTPFGTATLDLVVAMKAIQKAAEMTRAKAIVVMPHCRMSGAARVAGDLTHALVDIYGSDHVIVIRTDLSQFDHPEWFPRGCRQIDFAGIATPVKQPERLQQLLFHALRSMAPEVIINVNSKLFWEMSAVYGPALADCARCYAYMFCAEVNPSGAETGYPVRFFTDCFDDLTGMITDSVDLADTLRERFLLPADQARRITTLSTPLREERVLAPMPNRQSGQRPKVFWAGRFDRQKRFDILKRIAQEMPSVDFWVWGKPVLDKDFSETDLPENMYLKGVYGDFSDLPLESCDAWLYTAQWDGVPTILMDVAASGVPLVASHVGGTGEILIDGLCHRVSDVEDVMAFVKGLNAVLDDPATARDRAVTLRKATIDNRTPERYRAALETFLNVGAMS
ncbi:MAG: glycosyltransferase family 4 protein [Pseudomonadota bacterium]